MRGILGFLVVGLSLIACAGSSPDIDGTPFCETLGGGVGGVGGSGGAGGVDGGASCTICAGDTRTGTRLKPLYLTGNDGSKMRYGSFWVDTAFGDETCAFQTLPNGEVRCIPPNEKIVSYLDSACTKPIYVHFGCGNGAGYVLTTDYQADVCAPPLAVNLWRVDAEIVGLDHYFVKVSGEVSGCINTSLLANGARTFNVKATQPIDTFVLGTVGEGL